MAWRDSGAQPGLGRDLWQSGIPKRNSVAQIRRAESNAKTKFSTQHDSIFFYAKSANAKFNGVMLPHSEKEIAAKYKHIDKDGRRYRLAWGWQYQLTGENRKIYLDESPGRAIGNLWGEEGLQLNTSSRERVPTGLRKSPLPCCRGLSGRPVTPAM